MTGRAAGVSWRASVAVRWAAAGVMFGLVGWMTRVRALAGPEWADGIRVGSVMEFAPQAPDGGWLMVSTVCWVTVGGCALMLLVRVAKWYVQSQPVLRDANAQVEADESFWFRKRSLFRRE